MYIIEMHPKVFDEFVATIAKIPFLTQPKDKKTKDNSVSDNFT